MSHGAGAPLETTQRAACMMDAEAPKIFTLKCRATSLRDTVLS